VLLKALGWTTEQIRDGSASARRCRHPGEGPHRRQDEALLDIYRKLTGERAERPGPAVAACPEEALTGLASGRPANRADMR